MRPSLANTSFLPTKRRQELGTRKQEWNTNIEIWEKLPQQVFYHKEICQSYSWVQRRDIVQHRDGVIFSQCWLPVQVRLFRDRNLCKAGKWFCRNINARETLSISGQERWGVPEEAPTAFRLICPSSFSAQTMPSGKIHSPLFMRCSISSLVPLCKNAPPED